MVASEFDRGVWRARLGRACGLQINRLLDSEIVALPQRERERTHVKRIDKPAGTTEDLIAQVITTFGGQRAVRGVSASVVLVASEIDEDNGSGVGDGEDLEGTVGQVGARETESTALVAFNKNTQVTVILV